MKKTVVIMVVILCIIAIGVCSAILFTRMQENNSLFLGTEVINGSEEANETIVAELPKVQIFKGTDRPIAIMIDNNIYAQPQAGLNDAYMVYEIIVEGGESRLMALFKGINLDKIGPVRSSRHYFLDYALENDAIYVHYGWSPQAQSDISTLGVNNINGISETTKEFWRVKDKQSPHNVATSTEKILEIANRKGYRTTSSKESVLNYVTDEVNLDAGQIAEDITIPYSQSNIVKWSYDEVNKNLHLTYPAIGVTIDIVNNDSKGIVLYSNYYFTDLSKRYIAEEKITLKSNEDAIFNSETNRRLKENN